MKSWTWILVPLLVVSQYEIWLAPGGVVSVCKLHRQINHEVSINQEWLRRNQILIAEIQDLKNGDQALEDHARTDLGMIKSTEVLYQLP